MRLVLFALLKMKLKANKHVFRNYVSEIVFIVINYVFVLKDILTNVLIHFGSYKVILILRAHNCYVT